MTWTFFPRSAGPLLSVLLPSRGRAAQLLECMDSVWSLAKDRSLVEFIVKVDDDDEETTKTLRGMKERVPSVQIKVVVSPQAGQYYNWINDLAPHAQGDWLLPFSDQATFKTEGWDQRLLNAVEKDPWFGIADACLVKTNDPRFCFVRRKTFEILGTLSPYPEVGTWLQQVFDFLNCSVELGINVDCPGTAASVEFSSYAKTIAIEILNAHFDKIWDKIKHRWLQKPEWHGWYTWTDGEGDGWNVVYHGRDGSVYGLQGSDTASMVRLGTAADLPGTWLPLDEGLGLNVVRVKSAVRAPKVMAGDRPTSSSVWTTDRPAKDGWYWHRDPATREVTPVMVTGWKALIKQIDGVANKEEKRLDDMTVGEWTAVNMMEKEGHKRGTGPLCSVLLPSRGRPGMLVECVRSFYDNAFDKEAIEVLVKVDDDDQPTIDAANQLEALGMATLFKSPRGNGYADLHKWVNWLSAEAKGDWLYVFNDDARMTTPQWDLLLLNEYPQHPAARREVSILVTPIENRPNSHEFMFTRRKIFDLLGHYSLIPQLDTWMFTIGVMIQCLNYTPIRVEHRNDGMNDGTAQDRRRASEANLHLVVSPPSILGRLRDCLTLLAYLEGFWWGH